MQQRAVNTIRNQVYQIIKEDICSGYYKPGQWLQETNWPRACRSAAVPCARPCVGWPPTVWCGDPHKGVFVKEFTCRDIEEVFDLR